jgi:hypothetical protein
MKYSQEQIINLRNVWENAINVCLQWFEPNECFRRQPLTKSCAINRALFDLSMFSASKVTPEKARLFRKQFRQQYDRIMRKSEFIDLISRAVDHTKRTKRRFEIWNEIMGRIIA